MYVNVKVINRGLKNAWIQWGFRGKRLTKEIYGYAYGDRDLSPRVVGNKTGFFCRWPDGTLCGSISGIDWLSINQFQTLWIQVYLLRKRLGYDLAGEVPSQTVFGSIG